MTIVCGRQALFDFRKKQEQIVKISNLLSAKPGEVALAVEKQKEELQAKSYVNVSLYRQLIEACRKNILESENPVLLWKEGLSPVQLRELANQFCQDKKGGLFWPAQKRRRLSICADKQTGGCQRAFQNFKQPFKRQRRRRSQMAQGTFFASREAVEQVFWEELNGIK